MKSIGVLFTLIAVASAAQAEPPVAPPPPPPPLPAPIVLSPPSVVERSRFSEAERLPSAQFEVDVTLNAERLWAGSLRVASRAGASMDQNINQSFDPCGNETETASRMRDAQRVSVRIDRPNERQEPDLFMINVNTTRPIAACEGGGSLTLGFNRSQTIKAGQSVVLDGDGKLKVRLMRKR